MVLPYRYQVRGRGWNNSKRAWGLRRLQQADVAILHLTAIGFKADRASFRKFDRILQHFAVASAVRDTMPDGDLDCVPILRLVLLKLLVRTGDEIIATLQLWLANEDTAVR